MPAGFACADIRRDCWCSVVPTNIVCSIKHTYQACDTIHIQIRLSQILNGQQETLQGEMVSYVAANSACPTILPFSRNVCAAISTTVSTMTPGNKKGRRKAIVMNILAVLPA